MDIKLTLDSKEINPGVINLRQFASGTDKLVFAMDDYIYETTDLSLLDAYAVCIMPDGRTDEMKLTKDIVNENLRITWNATGYTT